MKWYFIVTLSFYFILSPIFSQDIHWQPEGLNRLNILENYQVRILKKDTIYSSLYRAKTAKESIVSQDDFSHQVKFKVVLKGDALFFLFLNLLLFSNPCVSVFIRVLLWFSSCPSW